MKRRNAGNKQINQLKNATLYLKGFIYTGAYTQEDVSLWGNTKIFFWALFDGIDSFNF